MHLLSLLAVLAIPAYVVATPHTLARGEPVDITRRADGKSCLRRRGGRSTTVTSSAQCNDTCNSWYPATNTNMGKTKRGTVSSLDSCLALCKEYFPNAAASSNPTASSVKPAAAVSAKPSSSSAKPLSASAMPASSSAKPATPSVKPASSVSKAAASSSKPAAASSSTAAASPAGSTEQAFVDAHNVARAAYGAGPVTWNAELATFAAAAATKCQMVHTNGPYGENLAGGTGNYGAQDAVDAWMEEASDYNYASPGFASGTGHFTQVVWKATTEIGCAIQNCADGTLFSGYGSSNYIVCEYKAPGNYEGQYPANVGTKV